MLLAAAKEEEEEVLEFLDDLTRGGRKGREERKEKERERDGNFFCPVPTLLVKRNRANRTEFPIFEANFI